MAQAEAEEWFILDRVVPVQDGANALVDPNLGLKLPLDRAPPRVTRLTARTGVGVVRGQLSIVASCNKDLLLHEHERPSEPDTPSIFFLALDTDFMPDERAAAAAGRRVFDVIATRLPNRTPGLPHFSGVRNVGFLSHRGGSRKKGTNVVAELQADNREPCDNTVPFITCRSRRDQENNRNTLEWEWHRTHLNWPVLDDEANPQWTTHDHDVIAHDEKLWWVNLSRGLVACDPAPVQDQQPTLQFVALPVLAGFEDRHEPPEQIDSYRIVGVSAGRVRFVDVARRRNDPEEQTRVVVWTLDLPELITNARWENNPRQTTLANIWNSANYEPMPRGVPVVALVDPNEPAVVYFFLDQYVFSVDVIQGAVVNLAVMPGQQDDGVPRPIYQRQRDVLAWKRPPFDTILMGDRPWHDFIHCPLNNHQCQSLKQYAQTHSLNENVEVPGCASLKRRRGTVHSKQLLRRAFRAVVACHKAGICMRGKFNAENFVIDENSHVRLHNVRLLELTNKEDADEDYYEFVRMSFNEVYDREPAPLQVIRWLKLINKGRQGYEYVICYHSSMMEHHQAITCHMSLYMIFLELEKGNPNLYELIIRWMPQYDKWDKKWKTCTNALIQKARTYRDQNSGKEATYESDVTGLLKLIRNSWQHPCRFHEAVLTLIIEVDFPNLLADFQETMFDAAQLGKLNLEAIME